MTNSLFAPEVQACKFKQVQIASAHGLWDTSDTATAHHGTHLATGLTVLGSFLVISIMDLFPVPPPLQELPTTFVFPRMNGKLNKHGLFHSLMLFFSRSVENHKVDCLPSSGTKVAQRDRLVKFSQAGMAKWKSVLFTLTHIPHKGVRNGGVTKRKPLKRVHHILQKDQRTLIARWLWTGFYPGLRLIVRWKRLHWRWLLQTSVTLICLSKRLVGPTLVYNRCLTMASTNIFPSDEDHTDLPTLPSLKPPQAVSAFVPEVSERAPVISSDAPGRALQCTLTFANGMKMTVYKHEVPPMQPFCYTTDLQHLIQSWDDGSADWAPPPDHPIIIHGHPIPIKLWGELYRFNKMASSEWKRLKSDWSNWQQASSTPEAFWVMFSNSQGQHLKFSHIMKILKEKYQQGDNNIASEARQVFDKEFINQFGYEKEFYSFLHFTV
ncbi:hypothetical protein ARMGADRAFT_1032485 [Armillaria gallica]|uniref:Uncharacterized protein n=1 Tax=Armillaria gallica TaxID=47427 RepID=A0A2H3D8P7_ARMGA|nr:hypothetical protein ARMGADRAFT_1032485 [Armillaria gallica]